MKTNLHSWTAALLFVAVGSTLAAQTSPTWSEDVAPIVFKHCTGCHRPGEIAPFPLTNFAEASAWGSMLRYVTDIRYMPPWKPDPALGVEYLQENYLTDDQIATISDWVGAGMPEGDPALTPELPDFPTGSQVGTPDLVLSFAESHLHPGNGTDEYRYFVLPTGLTTARNLVALEMRPGNKSIVHHALTWVDTTGTAAALDAQTPGYGYTAEEVGQGIGASSLNNQLPGYVPGVRAHVLTNGMAQRVPPNSDLLVQVHYAPVTIDERDSSSFNLFFTDQPVSRFVRSEVMVPLPGTLINGPFIIPANQTREFHGVLNVPIDVSILGLAPHMHLLGTHWDVYAVTPTNDTISLIRINEWDFNWQGGYYFRQLIRLPQGSQIHALAGYDNTTNNPLNPNSPPRLITWGEGTADEMYYLPIYYVPYQAGDEELVLDDLLNDTENPVFHFTQDKLYPVAPNPAVGSVKVGYTLGQSANIRLDVHDASGRRVQTLVDGRRSLPGEHVITWDTSALPNGLYVLTLQVGGTAHSQKVVVQR